MAQGSPSPEVQGATGSAPGASGEGQWRDLEWEPVDAPARPTAGKRGPFQRLFGTWFGRLLLPAIIAQSILIGGGYATGREVVEYGARFGAMGWVVVLTVFVVFSLVSVLVFEFARVTRAYDYKSFTRGLIGRGWPLFDAAYAVMAVLVVAVITAAAGEVVEQVLGLAAELGIVLIVGVVAVLAYFGARVIEAFKTIGTTALYLGYVVFGVIVLTAGWGDIVSVFQRGDTTHAGEVGTPLLVWTGVLYVGYNLAIYPAVLFSLHRQGGARDSVVSGVLSGLVMTLPFLLTYLCILAFYPAQEVVGARVPWMVMLEQTAGTWVLVLFAIVVGWTLLETSIGLVHAILDRLDRDIVKVALPGKPRGHRLPGLYKALLGAVGLFAAAMLSQVGIMGLVGTGYLIMAYVFIAVFAVPLLTVGVWKILRSHGVAPYRRAAARGAPSTGSSDSRG
jgi:uncharacterized membrane protein YkvI